MFLAKAGSKTAPTWIWSSDCSLLTLLCIALKKESFFSYMIYIST